METKLEQIAAKARREPNLRFTSLAHHVTHERVQKNLSQMPKRSAAGVDGQTVEAAKESFEEWIEPMLQSIHRQGYRAPDIRRVYIPKPGKTEKRPLGVPTVSDRALQRSSAEVLSAICEQDFLPCSFGGRPKLSAHHALATLNEVVAGGMISWVLANPYDDCILQYMGTAQNQAAVYAIERACMGKTSVSIPPDDNFTGGLSADVGNFNIGFGGLEYGIVVTMKNTTNYNITEVMVSIINKTTHEVVRYPVTAFHAPLPPGAVITGLGEPALQIIKPGQTDRFFVHITEATANPSAFGKTFTWSVMPTKGIPAN